MFRLRITLRNVRETVYCQNFRSKNARKQTNNHHILLTYSYFPLSRTNCIVKYKLMRNKYKISIRTRYAFCLFASLRFTLSFRRSNCIYFVCFKI